MRVIPALFLIFSFFCTAFGCSAVSDFDFTFPEEEDDGQPTPAEHAPSSVVQTSGGGIISSNDYKLNISIGMPQPMGNSSSDGYRIEVGPETVVK